MLDRFVQTDKLIQWYWLEHARLKNSEKHYVFESDGICQCSSESIIQDSIDSEQMRTFLMIGVLNDEIMYAHFKHFYSDFRERFRYPKLHQHGGIGMMHPNWFRFAAQKKNLKINWERVEEISDCLLGELGQWFETHRGKEEWSDFKGWWRTESYFLTPNSTAGNSDDGALGN